MLVVADQCSNISDLGVVGGGNVAVYAAKNGLGVEWIGSEVSFAFGMCLYLQLYDHDSWIPVLWSVHWTLDLWRNAQGRNTYRLILHSVKKVRSSLLQPKMHSSNT